MAILALLAVLSLALVGCSAQGPFEPDWKSAWHECKLEGNDTNPYCAPKPGTYPDPKRPPGWLAARLPAAPQNYVGLHNDLGALLKLRARDKWVTVFQYTLGQRDFFLNALYTYLRFGDADFFIVATVTHGAFRDCVEMQLPCYNATPHYEFIASRMICGDGTKARPCGNQLVNAADSHHTHHNFGSILHVQLTWMNVHMGLAILEAGYHFQHSDVDVAFMRKVLPSLGLLERLGGDVAMLTLGLGHTFNPANCFARSTPGSIAFFKSYMRLVNRSLDNELAVNVPELNATFWRCSTKEACNQTSAANLTAMVELPTLSAAASCYQPRLHGGACDSRRLFVHMLCAVGRPWKTWATRNLGLWFLTDFSGNEVNETAGLGPVLPCAAPDDVAWHKPLAEYYANG